MTRQKSKGSLSTEENLNCKSACFTEEDRKQLKEINVSFEKLIDEVNELKSELAINKRILEETKEENQRLKQQLNLSLYKSDSLEQYGRRENLRIYNVPESANKKDDAEDIIIEIAKLLNPLTHELRFFKTFVIFCYGCNGQRCLKCKMTIFA